MTEHQVTFTTADGVDYAATATGEQSLLDAAADAGHVLPAMCRQGACGMCVAAVTSGDVRRAPANPDAMGPAAGEGAALLCRTYAHSDCAVALPYDSTKVVESAPTPRQAAVEVAEPVADGVVRLLLRLAEHPEFGTAAEFDAGQYMQVEVPGRPGMLRAYSMANASSWDGLVEFYVRVQPHGAFSEFVVRAEPGDQVTVIGPQGTFGLVENGLAPRWFVAGGTGVAPLLAMLRRMSEWADPQNVTMVVGCNNEADLFAHAALADVAQGLTQFRLVTCIWHPEAAPDDTCGAVTHPGWTAIAKAAADRWLTHDVVVGTPADALAQLLPEAGNAPDFYVCGPPPMVVAAEYALAEHGVDPARVYVERFTAN